MKRTEELTELRHLTEKQLFAKIKDGQKQVVLLKQDKLLGKLNNPHQLTQLRKSLARLHTVLDEKVASQVSAQETEKK